jgi:CRISPR-associated protein Csm3
MQLIGKIIISGKIKTLTGLHIGGSKSAQEIGGVDLNVVKNANGQPYLPGSSLKGRLRAMLAKTHGSLSVEKDPNFIKEMFGAIKEKRSSGKKDDKGRDILLDVVFPTRIFVRDAFLDLNRFLADYPDPKMAGAYTDIKFENTIDRASGMAAHGSGLRQIERVPEGCYFDFEVVYDLHADIAKDGRLKQHLDGLRLAFQLTDTIGGHGSRGYGHIAYQELEVKTIHITGGHLVEGPPAAHQAEIAQFTTGIKALQQS